MDGLTHREVSEKLGITIGGSTDFSTAVAMDISTDTEVGDSVNLVGRTTGRSTGEVVDTCVAENGPYSGYRFL